MLKFILNIHFVLLTGALLSQLPQTIKQINTGWKFKAFDDTSWLAATVPGTVHTDLMDNGIIEDPYYRLNERKVQWIDKKDWIYQHLILIAFLSIGKIMN